VYPYVSCVDCDGVHAVHQSLARMDKDRDGRL